MHGSDAPGPGLGWCVSAGGPRAPPAGGAAPQQPRQLRVKAPEGARRLGSRRGGSAGGTASTRSGSGGGGTCSGGGGGSRERRGAGGGGPVRPYELHVARRGQPGAEVGREARRLDAGVDEGRGGVGGGGAGAAAAARWWGVQLEGRLPPGGVEPRDRVEHVLRRALEGEVGLRLTWVGVRVEVGVGVRAGVKVEVRVRVGVGVGVRDRVSVEARVGVGGGPPAHQRAAGSRW